MLSPVHARQKMYSVLSARLGGELHHRSLSWLNLDLKTEAPPIRGLTTPLSLELSIMQHRSFWGNGSREVTLHSSLAMAAL